MLDLAFDESKTDVKKVEVAIIKAGHDTEIMKATDVEYDKLPGCCHYDRSNADVKKDKKMYMTKKNRYFS